MEQPYVSGFGRLVEKIQEESADLVVAIARKGPRLLELLHGLFPGQLGDVLDNTFSDRAIPLMGDEVRNRPVLVFDDILIYGSTYRDVRNDLLALGAKPRGLVYAYVGNAEKAPGLEPPVSVRSLSPDETFAFSTEMSLQFGQLAKAYDLEYPILSTSSSWVNADDFESRLRQTGLAFSRLRYPSWYDSAVSGFSVVLPVEWLRDLAELTGLDFGHAKLRVYLHEKSQIMRVSPMIFFSAKRDVVRRGLLLGKTLGGFLSEAQERVQRAGRNGWRRNDEVAQEEAAFRVLWYCVQLLGWQLMARRRDSPIPQLFPVKSMGIDPLDLQILFGQSLAGSFVETVLPKLNNGDLLDEIPGRATWSSPAGGSMPLTTPSDLLERIRVGLRGSGTSLEELRLGWDAWSSLDVLFYGMHLGLDAPVRASREAPPGRLKFGASFGAILEFVSASAKCSVSPIDVSFLLDEFIDAGAAVPLFLLDSEAATWYRGFRFGEGSPYRRHFLVHHTLQHAADRGEPGLAPFYFHKTFAALRQAAPFSPLIKAVPYDCINDLYGRFAVTEIDHPENLETWSSTYKVAEWDDVNRSWAPAKGNSCR